MVDAILYVAIHKGRKIIDRIIDTMVCDASLREIVCPYFCRTVSSAYHSLSSRCNIIEIFSMLPVIYEGAEPRQSALLVLGLIPRLGALYQNLFHSPGVRIAPVVAQTDT